MKEWRERGKEEKRGREKEGQGKKGKLGREEREGKGR